MKEIGLTDTALGKLMVAGTVASFLFSFVSAPVVDRMGRKRATFVFDLLSSALPPLVYLFSKNFFFALLAVILFNSNKIMSIAYYLVMIEDSDEESRIVAFNLFNIITVAAGLLIPLGGILVNKYGLVSTERAFLLISFLMMTGMILFRNMLLKETGIGEKIRAASAGKGLSAFFKTQSLALGGNVMVILTDDPQKVEAAWEYISYLTSAEKNAEFALATGYLPIRKSELDNADIQKALSENELYAIAFKQLDYTFAYTHFEQMGTMDSLLRNMLNKLEKNRGTSQDLLDKAAKDLKSEIDEG